MILQLSRPAAAGGVATALLVAGLLAPPAQAAGDRADPGDVGAHAIVEGASVVTIVPVRVVAETAVAPGGARCVDVAGTRGIPADATAVVVNVTTVAPNGAGNAVVFPGASGPATPDLPATSTVNFEPGRDVASTTFVGLGPDGDLCYGTRGATRSGLLLDVSGYVDEGAGVVVQSPQRLLDTRTTGGGGALAPRTARAVPVAGELDVPDDAESVILTVTVAGVTAVGNLRVYPGGDVTETSVVNYAPGVDKANTTVVGLADDGTVSLYSDSDRPVHVVLDVVGWTETGGRHVPMTPVRAFDTRADPVGDPIGPLESGFVVGIGLEDAVPAEATAAVLNITAIQPTTVGNLRVFQGEATEEPPNTSTINYITGRDIPNLVVVGLSADDEFNFFNVYSDQPDGGTVDLAVDVVGYITD